MTTLPDYFLASTESKTFRGPFKCWVEGNVIGEVRSDYLLIRIEPTVLDYQTKDLIERVIIAGRNKPIRSDELPVTVYIAKIKDAEVLDTHRCDASSIEVVAVGDLFTSQEEAQRLAESAE